jgi:chromosome segregation ATPase
MNKKLPGIFLAGILIAVAGCQSTYYKTMEAFGVHKRDLLKDNVEEARDSQTEAKEQFKSALEKFTEATNFRGGDLEAKYKELDAELERCESKAARVSERISKVEAVAEALFDEWEDELDQYNSQDLRRKSERKLDATRRQYGKLDAAMRRAEDKMDPVLVVFRDQVLFLKHNLNAKAIASLQDELVAVEEDVALLVKDMEASIAEADRFISTMTEE